MKKLFTLFLAVLFLMSFNSLKAQESYTWNEMNAFHTTAMKAFHASGSMQAARDSAAVMIIKIKDWQASSVPASCDAATVKPLLQTLTAECRDIYNAVRAKKSDDELKSLTDKAHNTFESIAAKCK